MSKKQMGFTLIEIVMVLVLLGILSAVAVPKYFDLRDQAEMQAAKATVAELQARLNAHFASKLLDGHACSDATAEGTTTKGARTLAIEAALAETDFGDWTVAKDTAATTTPTSDDNKLKVTVTNKTSKKTYPSAVTTAVDQDKFFQLTLPACNK